MAENEITQLIDDTTFVPPVIDSQSTLGEGNLDAPLLSSSKTQENTKWYHWLISKFRTNATSSSQPKRLIGSVAMLLAVVIMVYSGGVIGLSSLAARMSIPMSADAVAIIGIGTMATVLAVLHIFLVRSVKTILSLIFFTLLVMIMAILLLCIYMVATGHFRGWIIWFIGIIMIVGIIALYVYLVCEEDVVGLM